MTGGSKTPGRLSKKEDDRLPRTARFTSGEAPDEIKEMIDSLPREEKFELEPGGKQFYDRFRESKNVLDGHDLPLLDRAEQIAHEVIQGMHRKMTRSQRELFNELDMAFRALAADPEFHDDIEKFAQKLHRDKDLSLLEKENAMFDLIERLNPKLLPKGIIRIPTTSMKDPPAEHRFPPAETK